MSETATQPDDNGNTGQNPSELLINLLIPMFLACSANDIALARRAAAQTINCYRFHNTAELITVVQVIAFGLATIGSLSLSMTDEIPLATILRLQGNANALNRSEHRQRRILATPPPEQRTEAPQPKHDTKPEPVAAAVVAPNQPGQPEPEPTAKIPPAQVPHASQTASSQPQPAPLLDKKAAEAFAAFSDFIQQSMQPPPNLPTAQSSPIGHPSAALGGTAAHLLTASPPAPASTALSRGGG